MKLIRHELCSNFMKLTACGSRVAIGCNWEMFDNECLYQCMEIRFWFRNAIGSWCWKPTNPTPTHKKKDISAGASFVGQWSLIQTDWNFVCVEHKADSPTVIKWRDLQTVVASSPDACERISSVKQRNLNFEWWRFNKNSSIRIRDALNDDMMSNLGTRVHVH